MRGRKPTPTHLQLIRDNPGRRPLNENEPLPVGDLFEPPDWFSEGQRETWAYAIEHAPGGLLKCLDLSALVAWVIAADLHRRAVEAVNSTQLLVKTPSGVPMQNPYLPIVNRQALIMLKAAAELGFTPSSRTRVKVEGGSRQGAGASGRRGNSFAANRVG